MIDTREPKNGDFIAYLDQLQKESAVRLLGDRSGDILDQALATHTKPNAGHFFSNRASTTSAQQSKSALADAEVSRWLRKLVVSVVPIGAGALFFLYWLVAATTFLPLAIAIVLVAWGLRILSRAARQLPPMRSAHAQSAVAKVFTQPTKTK